MEQIECECKDQEWSTAQDGVEQSRLQDPLASLTTPAMPSVFPLYWQRGFLSPLMKSPTVLVSEKVNVIKCYLDALPYIIH